MGSGERGPNRCRTHLFGGALHLHQVDGAKGQRPGAESLFDDGVGGLGEGADEVLEVVLVGGDSEVDGRDVLQIRLEEIRQPAHGGVLIKLGVSEDEGHVVALGRDLASHVLHLLAEGRLIHQHGALDHEHKHVGSGSVGHQTRVLRLRE